MPPVSQLMDEFDICTKGNSTVNNQKDVILCDLMMELKERKCILFLRPHTPNCNKVVIEKSKKPNRN